MRMSMVNKRRPWTSADSLVPLLDGTIAIAHPDSRLLDGKRPHPTSPSAYSRKSASITNCPSDNHSRLGSHVRCAPPRARTCDSVFAGQQSFREDPGTAELRNPRSDIALIGHIEHGNAHRADALIRAGQPGQPTRTLHAPPLRFRAFIHQYCCGTTILSRARFPLTCVLDHRRSPAQQHYIAFSRDTRPWLFPTKCTESGVSDDSGNAVPHRFG